MHSMFQDGLVVYDDMMLGFEEIFLFKGAMGMTEHFVEFAN